MQLFFPWLYFFKAPTTNSISTTTSHIYSDLHPCAQRCSMELCKYPLTRSLSICLYGKPDTQEDTSQSRRRARVHSHVQHQAWPRTPCLLTNFLEGFNSSRGRSQLLERHHWQRHCYTIAQLGFLGNAWCIYALLLHLHAVLMMSVMTKCGRYKMNLPSCSLLQPPTPRTSPEEKKPPFPLYRIYLSNSFRINHRIA